jgi:excinuclease ABC subunit A
MRSGSFWFEGRHETCLRGARELRILAGLCALPSNAHGRHPHPRRAHAQPEEHRLDLPRNRLTVITGLSGSGKSSLAFDTLYAEGQRRYVESLSAYARQFLQLMEKPDVDLIEGLSPAISIEQKATSHNPRSTVGTVTEIHDYLRLLFARAGTPHCPDHGAAARGAERLADGGPRAGPARRHQADDPRPGGGRPQGRAGRPVRRAARPGLRAGARGRQGPRIDALPKLAKNSKHSIEVVVDRLKVRQDLRGSAWPNPSRPRSPMPTAAPSPWRWTPAPNTCSRRASPARSAATRCRTRAAPVLLQQPDGRLPPLRRPRPDHFFDPERVVATPTCRSPPAPSAAGTGATSSTSSCWPASPPTTASTSKRPSRSLPRRARQMVLYGSGRDKIAFRYLSDGGSGASRSTPSRASSQPRAPLQGNRLRRRARGAGEIPQHQALPGVRRQPPAREARHVLIGDRNLPQVSALPLAPRATSSTGLCPARPARPGGRQDRQARSPAGCSS